MKKEIRKLALRSNLHPSSAASRLFIVHINSETIVGSIVIEPFRVEQRVTTVGSRLGASLTNW